MKWASLTLFGILVILHWRGGDGAIAIPLSMFRDGNQVWLGYSAFALLIVMSALMARAAYHCGEFLTCAVYGMAIAMLVAIAATPSFDALHIIISLLLPLVLYLFYLGLLHSESSTWMFLHLFIPVLLLFGTQFHSFGAWQKCLILYFVILANLHHTFLPHPVRKKVKTRSNTNRDRERLIAEGWIDRREPRRRNSTRSGRVGSLTCPQP